MNSQSQSAGQAASFNNFQDTGQSASFNKEYTELIKYFQPFLALYVLKTATDKDCVLSIADVFDKMCFLISDLDGVSCDRTLRRHLEHFCRLEDRQGKDAAFDKLFQLLAFVCGGSVRTARPPKSRKGNSASPLKSRKGSSTRLHRRYYFEPILSKSDMDMLFGIIRSSRYLSKEEKDFLLARLRVLQPACDKKNQGLVPDQIEALPDRPKPPRRKSTGLPVKPSQFLSNIQCVYEAIERKCQIEVIYGIYDMSESGRVSFHARNPKKPYILNPYATMWNEGKHYLIATHKNHDNPTHFRLDRIVSVKLHRETDANGDLVEAKRAPVPALLKRYFRRKKSGVYEFDAIQYANTYPEMRIYQNENLVDCRFLCAPESLQILVDYFGENISLEKQPVSKEQENPDGDAPFESRLVATVKNVQYDNALGFCVMMSDQLKLVSPPELVDDVYKKLTGIAEKYKP